MPLKGFEGDPGMPYNGVDFVEALNSLNSLLSIVTKVNSIVREVQYVRSASGPYSQGPKKRKSCTLEPFSKSLSYRGFPVKRKI